MRSSHFFHTPRVILAPCCSIEAFAMYRLAVLTLLMLTTPVVLAAADQSKQWQFRVYLDDREIGIHDFHVSQAHGQTIVESNARFNVKLLFVTVFRYRHQTTETWDDNCLQRIESQTDENGRDFSVQGRASDGSFLINNGTDGIALPSCIMTFAYWNPAILHADQLLDPQTGAYMEVTTTFQGMDTLSVANTSVLAHRYEVQLHQGPITLWYDAADKRWLGLQASARGGRVLRYVPTAAPLAGHARLAALDAR